MEKKFDGNYSRMLRVILNKSWWQQLYGYLPPIMKTIPVQRTKHAGHRWRSKDELIIDVLLWTPSHRRAKAGRPAKTYIQQLCANTGCSLEYLPGVMNDRDGWRERVREIRAGSVTWRWGCVSTYVCETMYVFCVYMCCCISTLVCLWLCVCESVWESVFILLCMHFCVCMYFCVFTTVYVCMCVPLYMYFLCVCTSVYVFLYVYVPVALWIYFCVCMCFCISIFTQPHCSGRIWHKITF